MYTTDTQIHIESKADHKQMYNSQVEKHEMLNGHKLIYNDEDETQNYKDRLPRDVHVLSSTLGAHNLRQGHFSHKNKQTRQQRLKTLVSLFNKTTPRFVLASRIFISYSLFSLFKSFNPSFKCLVIM